jgi:hypothetical protein
MQTEVFCGLECTTRVYIGGLGECFHSLSSNPSFIHLQQKKMENLEFQPNTHLAAVYYNGREANLFRIHIDITLGDLKHQLTQLNSRCHYRDKEGSLTWSIAVRRSAPTDLSCSQT